MSTNENSNSIKNLIKDALKEDGGFYLAVVTLLGYFLTTVQQIVRYAYYGVELTYLLNIKLEDILLGIFYVAGLSLFFLLPYELAKRTTKKVFLFVKQFVFFLICCAYAYALTLRFAVDFFIVFFLIIVGLDIAVDFFYHKFSTRVINWLDRTSALEKVTLIFISLVALIVVLQFSIESYNKRFTYIVDDNRCYSVLTTYQDCYLTIESVISDNEITILKGNVRLLPISGSTLEAKQFAIKNIK